MKNEVFKTSIFESEPDLIPVCRVAALAGLSEQTIRREIGCGHLPGRKIGRRWFVPKALLAAYFLGVQKVGYDCE